MSAWDDEEQPEPKPVRAPSPAVPLPPPIPTIRERRAHAERPIPRERPVREAPTIEVTYMTAEDIRRGVFQIYKIDQKGRGGGGTGKDGPRKDAVCALGKPIEVLKDNAPVLILRERDLHVLPPDGLITIRLVRAYPKGRKRDDPEPE